MQALKKKHSPLKSDWKTPPGAQHAKRFLRGRAMRGHFDMAASATWSGQPLQVAHVGASIPLFF